MRMAIFMYALIDFCEFNVSDKTRIEAPNKSAHSNIAALRPRFLTNLIGEVTAAELPQLGLSRVKRQKGEAESAFRQRVHLELVKAHFEWSGPFYELLDTSTLIACKQAIEAIVTVTAPNLHKSQQDSGEFYFLPD